MKNLLEARVRLEQAARTKPALRKLLAGDIKSPEDVREMADAAAQLGVFELSFLLRSIADGGADLEQNVSKLALYVTSMADGELVDEFRKRIAGESAELGELLELFRRIPR